MNHLVMNIWETIKLADAAANHKTSEGEMWPSDDGDKDTLDTNKKSINLAH